MSKETLHSLVDELPEAAEPAAARLLAHLRESGAILYRQGNEIHVILPGDDPFLRTLARAREDDEPETDDERAAVTEAEEDLRHGRVIEHEEVRHRLLS